MTANVDKVELLALHGHFVAALAVKEFLLDDARVYEETARKLGKELTAAAQLSLKATQLQVFYALVYVVVEGYLELGCQRPVRRSIARTITLR